MAQPPRTDTITVGDETFTLVYNANAMLSLEVELGLEGFNQIGEKFSEGKPLSMGSVIKLLWCGLITLHPDITQEEVGALISFENAMELLGTALKLMTGQNLDPEREIARDQEVRTIEHPLSGTEPESPDWNSGPSLDSTSDSPRLSSDPALSESWPS